VQTKRAVHGGMGIFTGLIHDLMPNSTTSMSIWATFSRVRRGHVGFDASANWSSSRRLLRLDGQRQFRNQGCRDIDG